MNYCHSFCHISDCKLNTTKPGPINPQLAWQHVCWDYEHVLLGRWVAQSVQLLTMGWTVRDRILVGTRFSTCPPDQTGPGAHPASCKMGTGSFLGVKCGRGVLLTPFQCRGHGRVEPYLYPPSGPHWTCNGITLPLLLGRCVLVNDLKVCRHQHQLSNIISVGLTVCLLCTRSYPS